MRINVTDVSRCAPHDGVAVGHPSAERSTGQLTLHEGADLVDRQWGWPANGSIVFPVVATQLARCLLDEARRDEGPVHRTRRHCETDDGQDTTRTNQIFHSPKTALGVDVVEHGA